MASHARPDVSGDKSAETASDYVIVELSNFNPHAMAEHEVMIAEALADESLATDVLNDENMFASGYQVASPVNSVQSSLRCSNPLLNNENVVEKGYQASPFDNLQSPLRSSNTLLNSENMGMVANGFQASPINNLQSPLRSSNPTPSPLRTITPGRNLTVNSVPLTPPVTPKVNVDVKERKDITTLVFFDLETTGLPQEMGKHNVQITELSMIAMKRMEFEKSVQTELKDLRIVQKLSMCFQPRAMIAPMAAKITGLNSSNLSDCSSFDQNAATTVLSFLAHLPKPVGLLAHNGKTFDFPILKAELNRHQMKLPSDILLADTLLAFRELGTPVFPPTKKVCKGVKFTKGNVSYALDNLHLFFFNKKASGSHSSEGDCMTLAKVCHEMKDTMLPWVDDNSFGMDSVQSMW